MENKKKSQVPASLIALAIFAVAAGIYFVLVAIF